MVARTRTRHPKRYSLLLVCIWLVAVGLFASYGFYLYATLHAEFEVMRQVLLDEPPSRMRRMDPMESMWRNSSILANKLKM
jgi:hypothetical protein